MQFCSVNLFFPATPNESIPLSFKQSLEGSKFLLAALQLTSLSKISISFHQLEMSHAVVEVLNEDQTTSQKQTFYDADLLLAFAFNGNNLTSKSLTLTLPSEALTQWAQSIGTPSKSTSLPYSLPHSEEFQRLLPPSFFPNLQALQRLAPGSECLKHRPGLTKDPLPGAQNRLITAALPYVNNVPHLGNIIGCVLSADVFARYCRLRPGVQTLFICGTDEYGTATETKALEEGISCAALCDKYHALQRDIYQWFDISFDHFGRTTTEKQTEIAQDIFNKLNDRQMLLKESVEQLLCTSCDRFLADRFVEGTCPLCSFADARGDQCDGCGKLLNAVDLIEPKCKLCRSRPEVRSSEHLFLNLPELQPQCEQWLSGAMTEGHWSANGVQITKSWLQEGLKPRCITRDLKWGTPVPLPEMKDKVFYVWFDAPIGYISITANYTDNWRAWWKKEGQSEVELFQFMGKDNVPFHSVVFPCSLLGTGEQWTLVHHISTTEFLNFEGGKFSKSRNVGVFGNNVVASGIPTSVWRYYLLINRPESSDTTFLWDDFAVKCNSELLANLGNYVSRVVRFTKAKYSGLVPAYDSSELLQSATVQKINQQISAYLEAMEVTKLKVALKAAMAISTLGNEFLTLSKLDNSLFVRDPRGCAQVIGTAINIVHLLATLLYPFIPATSEMIYGQLNAPVAMIPDSFECRVLEGHVLGEPEHLFVKIEEAKLEQLRRLYGGGSA